MTEKRRVNRNSKRDAIIKILEGENIGEIDILLEQVKSHIKWYAVFKRGGD